MGFGIIQPEKQPAWNESRTIAVVLEKEQALKNKFAIQLNKFCMGIIILFFLLLMLIMSIPSVHAADFSVSTAAELNQAIIAANNNSEEDTVTLTANIILTDTLTTITSDITINGDGFTVDINNHYRLTIVTGLLTLNNITVINGNNDGSFGGGALLNAGGTLTINDSNFSSNTASVNGGSIYNTGSLIVTNSTFSNNLAENKGGAIYNDNGEITINQSSFLTNTSSTGGGAISSSGANADATIHNSNFTSNYITGIDSNGGGISNEGVMLIDDSTFRSNNADNNDGGGIFNYKSLTITSSTFLNNNARRGGGIYNHDNASLIIENSTFSGNSADYGGGILIYSDSSATINSSTIYNNSAVVNGGGIRNNGEIFLNHNLISGNSAPIGSEFYHSVLQGAVTIANDFNLFGHSGLTDAQAFYNFLPGASDFNATINTPPSTGHNIPITNILNTSLTDNGGPTLTHALVAGSPAVDIYTDTLSTCPVTDQRGIERPWPNGGNCDSGAYELQYVNLNINSTNGTVIRNPDLQTIQIGDVITLTANADPHYYFDSWSGDLTSIDNPLVITMTGNLTVTANFLPIEYDLVINSDHGIVTLEPDQPTYHYGDVVTMTANAEPHWYFDNWSGDLTNTQNPVELTITGNMNVTANYLPAEYTLAITSEHGTVTLNPDLPTFHYGDDVTLTVDPDEHWSFDNWSGDLIGNSITETLTITGDMAVTANYLQLAFYLEILTAGNGVVDINPESKYGDGYYDPKEVVTLTAISEPGWTFIGWSGDATGITNPINITIEQDTYVNALFIQNEYKLEITSEHGSVVLNPDQLTYHYGDVVNLTSNPDPGWSFKDWSGDVTGSNNPIEITITGDTAIQANYILNEYILSINAINGVVIINPDQPTYHYGDQVTLTAIANSGWSFRSWNGDLNSNENPIKVTISDNMSIIATFKQTNIFLPIVMR